MSWNFFWWDTAIKIYLVTIAVSILSIVFFGRGPSKTNVMIMDLQNLGKDIQQTLESSLVVEGQGTEPENEIEKDEGGVT